MKDPFGAYRRISESVISYIETAFATRFPSLELERQTLLRQPGALSQEPWIEPLPRYESSGKRIGELDADDIPGLTPQAADDFRSLASSGLIGDFVLYQHQVDMFRKALGGRELRHYSWHWFWQDRVLPTPAVRISGRRVRLLEPAEAIPAPP